MGHDRPLGTVFRLPIWPIFRWFPALPSSLFRCRSRSEPTAPWVKVKVNRPGSVGLSSGWTAPAATPTVPRSWPDPGSAPWRSRIASSRPGRDARSGPVWFRLLIGYSCFGIPISALQFQRKVPYTLKSNGTAAAARSRRSVPAYSAAGRGV